MKALLFALLCVPAFAGDVIDVGKYQIEGTMRGPEVQLIDSNRVGDEAAKKLGQARLKEMETELLKTQEPFRREKK